jgi:solute carrier family 35, member C2
VSDAVASSTSTTLSHPTDIEMDPITPNPAGHRRRRSSLMSPASSAQGQPSGRGSHTRGPSVSGQFHTDEPKISEESQSTIKDKNGVMRHTPSNDFSDEDLHDDEETGLTTKERRRKQKKKRRNTLLDQRIARENVTAEEKKEADQTVIRKLAVNGTLIGLWYLFSLGISLVSPTHITAGQFLGQELRT